MKMNFKVPKNKKEFYYYLKYAFKQGCNHGYGVQLDKDVDYQEEFGMAGFINDIDGGMPFWPQQLKGNKMFSFVDAGTFIEMSKKCNSPKMKEVARKLTEESNPVLVEVTLK